MNVSIVSPGRLRSRCEKHGRPKDHHESFDELAEASSECSDRKRGRTPWAGDRGSVLRGLPYARRALLVSIGKRVLRMSG